MYMKVVWIYNSILLYLNSIIESYQDKNIVFNSYLGLYLK